MAESNSSSGGGSGSVVMTEGDAIELHVGPAGELSATGNPKARQFRAMLSVRQPKRVVWGVITDYANLANIMPNLAVSKPLPLPPDGPYPNATGRIYQEGEQRLFGWKVPMLISAGVILDFEEDEAAGTVRAYLVESAMLAEYHAEWRLEEEKRPDGSAVTHMYYSGVACPRGPVPQQLMEWQLRKDVPMNLRALKAYSELVGAEAAGVGSPQSAGTKAEEDEPEDESFVLAASSEEEESEEEEDMKDAWAEVNLGGEKEEEMGAGQPIMESNVEEERPQPKEQQQQQEQQEQQLERGVEGEAVVPTPLCCLPVRRIVSRE